MTLWIFARLRRGHRKPANAKRSSYWSVQRHGSAASEYRAAFHSRPVVICRASPKSAHNFSTRENGNKDTHPAVNIARGRKRFRHRGFSAPDDDDVGHSHLLFLLSRCHSHKYKGEVVLQDHELSAPKKNAVAIVETSENESGSLLFPLTNNPSQKKA